MTKHKCKCHKCGKMYLLEIMEYPLKAVNGVVHTVCRWFFITEPGNPQYKGKSGIAVNHC